MRSKWLPPLLRAALFPDLDASPLRGYGRHRRLHDRVGGSGPALAIGPPVRSDSLKLYLSISIGSFELRQARRRRRPLPRRSAYRNGSRPLGCGRFEPPEMAATLCGSVTVPDVYRSLWRHRVPDRGCVCVARRSRLVCDIKTAADLPGVEPRADPAARGRPGRGVRRPPRPAAGSPAPTRRSRRRRRSRGGSTSSSTVRCRSRRSRPASPHTRSRISSSCRSERRTRIRGTPS